MDGASGSAAPGLVNPAQQTIVRSVVRECYYVESALQRIMYGLEPFTVLAVLPVFAFFNSGITLDWANLPRDLAQPVTIGVFLGLLLRLGRPRRERAASPAPKPELRAPLPSLSCAPRSQA